MKIIANSLPKSGTHLLSRLLDLLEYEEYDLQLNAALSQPTARNPIRRYLVKRRLWHPGLSDTGVSVALDEPEVKIRKKWLINRLNNVGNDHYLECHLPYSKDLADLLIERGFKILFIVRDPRDVLVSFCNHIWRDDRYNPFHDYFRSIPSEEERLIVGLNGLRIGRHYYSDLKTRVNGILGWLLDERIFNVKFEELIGEKGAGLLEQQLKSIDCIASFIGSKLKDESAQTIANNIFYKKSDTFYKGKIGSWRESFTPHVKELFKKRCGDALIRLGYETKNDW